MNSEKRDKARDLYLHTLLSNKDIADILDVNRRTVYLWIKNGRWEEMRIAARRTPRVLVQNIYNHIDQVEQKIRRRPVEERCPTMQEIEMLRKLYNMLDKAGDTQGIGNYVQSFEHLINLISKEDHAMAQEVTRYADKIIRGFSEDLFWDLVENQDDMNENLRKMDKEDAALAATLAAEQPSTPSSPAEALAKEGPAEASVACPDLSGKEGAPGSPTPAHPSPAEASAKEGDETFCEKTENPNTSAEPAPEESHEASDNMNEPPKYPTSGFPASEIFSSDKPSLLALHFATLPPDQRPSPFRDGDILWVNDIEDLDNRLTNLGHPWGEQKMGDRIRRYSELNK